ERTLLQGSIAELRALYLDKSLSVVDAVTWFQSRIARLSMSGLSINAVREVSGRAMEEARLADAAIAADQAHGPLHGIPVLLKDNILAAGMSATAGAAALARFKPRQDAVLVRRLQAAGATLVRDADPVALPKACKNAVELEGVRVAHRRDGAAVSKFLGWLGRESRTGKLREIEVSDRLQKMREETGKLRDLSFDTISGAGPNGAIVHYRAAPSTERTLEPGSLYLVDSGGQYRDGTTDITRTVGIGTPTPEMKDRFTRVLKGHIALATARFPVGTTGSQLDALARYSLWQAGIDYDHGTGHGVGAYLSVHEGPHRISKVASAVALQPGMIVSNEPGYYKTGAYGIRIENLVAVKEARIEGADRKYLEFETLTLAPIDTNCIDLTLMTEAEKAWLNAYHAKVREVVEPQVDEATRDWLKEATRAI
ncbi:MAG: M24 family metallopeptidase, partial [Enhydrobacter sp.]